MWHEAYDFKTEEEMRLFFGVGMMTWLGNYMQCPVVPSGQEFKLVNWRSFSKLPDDAIGVMFCDPAGGINPALKQLPPYFFQCRLPDFMSPIVLYSNAIGNLILLECIKCIIDMRGTFVLSDGKRIFIKANI